MPAGHVCHSISFRDAQLVCGFFISDSTQQGIYCWSLLAFQHPPCGSASCLQAFFACCLPLCIAFCMSSVRLCLLHLCQRCAARLWLLCGDPAYTLIAHPQLGIVHPSSSVLFIESVLHTVGSSSLWFLPFLCLVGLIKF